jgi:dienelactone hydrolase
VVYDPFSPGPAPVSTRTVSVHDDARDRDFPVEIWQPDRGADAPLICFSHHSGGHRRSSGFLCTHLASHGYAVVALDHSEVVAPRTPQPDETAAHRQGRIDQIVADRVSDGAFLVDTATALFGPRPVGLVGHSFGGWTALRTADDDQRVDAVVAITPGGATTPRSGVLDAPLYPTRPVPTLFLAAEHDVPIPPADVRDVFARTPGATLLCTLHNADHLHFVDDVAAEHEAMRTMTLTGDAAWMPAAMRPIGELCPPEQAHAFTRALTLAHLDATLRSDGAAAAFLDDGLQRRLAAHGIAAEVEVCSP